MLEDLKRLEKLKNEGVDDMSDKKVWSHDEENFNSDSMGEVIRDYDLSPGAKVWSGTAYIQDPLAFINSDGVIEYARDSAFDEFGDYSEGFLHGVSQEEKKLLDDFLSDWLKKNSKITFYSVKDVTVHTITENDVNEANKLIKYSPDVKDSGLENEN